MDPAVFGYIRVSQAEGESGLATQRRILTDHGLRDDRIFTDVASGRNMRRPAWKQLREILQLGDVVVVPRIDRLARNLSEGLRTIEELHAQGIDIRSLAEGLDTGDDSPTSRLMLHMLLSLAEWERGTIRDRISAGVDRAAAKGRTGGLPPVRRCLKNWMARSLCNARYVVVASCFIPVVTAHQPESILVCCESSCADQGQAYLSLRQSQMYVSYIFLNLVHLAAHNGYVPEGRIHVFSEPRVLVSRRTPQRI